MALQNQVALVGVLVTTQLYKGRIYISHGSLKLSFFPETQKI
jgi:hypothetical protein